MLAAAAGVAVFAFVLRFNAMGDGPLGGFENDEFIFLMRAQLILADDRPLRDFPDAELQGAWPALTYAVPAWAQQVWGRTLLAEAYLTIGALALAAAIVFLLARDLSHSWIVALMAAALVVVTLPRHYSYPKVLVLACSAAVIRWLAHDRSFRPVAAAAGLTATAALFRHDLAVYAGAGVAVTFAVQALSNRTLALRRMVTWAGVTGVLLVPSMVWVQRYEGLGRYLRAALETSRNEAGRTRLRWPALDVSTAFDTTNLVAATYYVFWAVCLVAVVMLAWKGWLSRRAPTPAGTIGWGLVVVTVIANLFFLRANLPARFGDSAVAVALTAAWAAGLAPWAGGLTSMVAWAAPRLLLAMGIVSASALNAMAGELSRAGLADGAVAQRFAAVRSQLAGLPPAVWSDATAQGTLRAARYLAECTDPGDRVLLTTYAPEVAVLAGRPVAGGQRFGFGLYTAEHHQGALIQRLEVQSVPVVLTGVADYQEFVEDYPLVSEYVARRYRDAGMIAIGGEPRFRVFVEAMRPVQGTHADVGLPCFR